MRGVEEKEKGGTKKKEKGVEKKESGGTRKSKEVKGEREK